VTKPKIAIIISTTRATRFGEKGREVDPRYRRGPGARFARDYREGTHFCPTFDDAVTRHRMLNAIETAAVTGQRRTLG